MTLARPGEEKSPEHAQGLESDAVGGFANPETKTREHGTGK